MSLFADAAFIARKDVAFLLRQRETILWVFLMPPLFFYFIGTVTGGLADPAGSEERPDPLALEAPVEAGFLVDEIVRRLEQENFRVERPATAEELAEYRRRLVVAPPPAGYASSTAAVLAGHPAELTFHRRGEGPAADFDRVRVARAVYTVLADLVVLTVEEGGPGPEGFARLAAMPRALALEVEPAGRREEPPSGFAQAIPGTMVMFTMLVLLTSGAILLVVEREQGLLRRLASTPISAGSVVLGKWGARMALAVVQLAFAMALGSLLFGMDWGESLPMVFALLLGWAAFNASLAIFLGNAARTEAQTAGVGVLSTMVLAALGGCWWPIEVAPDWMQRLATVLPTGWAMGAMHKLVNFGYPPPVALPHLAALLLAALALGIAGARTFRYQ